MSLAGGPAGRPRTLKVVVAVNAVLCCIIMVIGLWIGASRNVLGFGVAALALVFFAIAVFRARRRFGPDERGDEDDAGTTSGALRR